MKGKTHSIIRRMNTSRNRTVIAKCVKELRQRALMGRDVVAMDVWPRIAPQLGPQGGVVRTDMSV